jgi:hypothetical protein
VPGDAAGGGASKRMMAGVMTGDTADERAADAALGIGRRSNGNAASCGEGERCMECTHENSSNVGLGERLNCRLAHIKIATFCRSILRRNHVR